MSPRRARLSIASAIGALSLITTLAAVPTAVAAAPQPTTLDSAFASAAHTYGVPADLISAVSYAQTGWQTHSGTPSVAGGWGPMHLLDRTLIDKAAAEGADIATPSTDSTLDEAASLTGSSSETLRSDAAANVAGGAALLADAQRRLGGTTGADSDPGAWYAAVAAISGSTLDSAATQFADDVFDILDTGATATVDGATLSLAAHPTTRDRSLLDRLGWHHPGSTPGGVDCPRTLDCEWLPAPYEQLSSDPTDYGNHDLANRPVSPTIDYIVIHDTEESYAGAISGATNPAYLAWNYTIRSSDGHVAQHLDAKNIGWHAGNWYVNTHSIGIEHEGYVADGTWFTEAMYRSSAKLVRYLAQKYGVPLDRGHIIGHDQVPALSPAAVKGMHHDPGTKWDWQHYFDLLGAPLEHGTVPFALGDVVRILPGFAGNTQQVTGCGATACDTSSANFVALRQAPSADAPLVNDPGLFPTATQGTTDLADIGPRAAAGTQYVVAERKPGWTAIWYLGQKAWFADAGRGATERSVVGAEWLTPKPGKTSIPLYGGAYPEASAYPAGITPKDQVPITPYTIPAGQRYAVLDDHVATDYYSAKTFSTDTPNDHIDITGHDRYLLISYGHRQYYVKASDVDVHRG